MPAAAKNKDFRPNKGELTFEEGGGVGWYPDYVKKFEGTGINPTTYGKNYERMMGTCKKCEHYEPGNDEKSDGSHCKTEICLK